MAGIGQSSVPSSDQSTPWNSQFSMGRSTNIDNHSNISNKYFPALEKRRLMPEENGVLPQHMYQYSRQQTGFQSSNNLSNDKSYLQPSVHSSGVTQPSNFGMYSMMGNLDQPPSQSKQQQGGFNANSSRLGGMTQFLESSSPSSANNHLYLPMSSSSTTPSHRQISSGSSMNPNVAAIFNCQSIMPISKNRSPYNFDNNHQQQQHQWDTQIGNFDSSEFPSLKTKALQSNNPYNYNLPNKSMLATSQINYQMVTKSGGQQMLPGDHHHQQQHQLEFSIQQEDFPALPVAQNPLTTAMAMLTCAESQGSSSASGGVVVNTNVSCDTSSQSRNSSIVDSNDFGVGVVQKSPYPNSFSESQTAACLLQEPGVLSLPSSSLSSSVPPPPPPPPPPLPSFSNNSTAQLYSRVQKKISQGPNNFIANIPNDMVADAFGLIGLVKLIGINDYYDNLSLLAPGLETLSLNRELDSHKDIFHSYVSPLSSNCAGRPHDMDYPVPREYRIRHILLDRLADPLPDKLSDETLFWIFYNLCGEECQLTAARQLMARQWRYNRRDKYWLTRDPSGVEPVTHASFERGSYLVWDSERARRVGRALTVYYKDLDNAVGPSSGAPRLMFPFCYNSPFMVARQHQRVSTSVQPQARNMQPSTTTTLAAALL